MAGVAKLRIEGCGGVEECTILFVGLINPKALNRLYLYRGLGFRDLDFRASGRQL